MSDSTPVPTLRDASPFPDKENNTKTPHIATGSAHKTPSRSRVSLGAPAGFYFKYMNSSKKSGNKSVLDESMAGDDNLTGTISIPGLNKSVNLAETSLLSIGNSSSESSVQSDGDLLNKSTLSDTTDLTASNFVLQTTSRQLAQSLKKRKRSEVIENIRPVALEITTNDPSPLEILEQEANKGPASTKSTASSASGMLLSQETPPGQGTAAQRRQSIRGSSPSLRQRMSATPKSLQKLTEGLRNQRMSRIARQEDRRRLSTDSNNSIRSLRMQLDLLNNENVKEAKVDRKRLPPTFTSTNGDDKTARHATAPRHQSCTTQEIRGAMEEVFAEEENEEKLKNSDNRGNANESSNSLFRVESPNVTPGKPAVETRNEVPTSINISSQRSVEKLSPEPCEDNGSKLKDSVSPSAEQASATLKLRFTPTKLTPSKLKATPRRILNPQCLDSPAKNTRSSSKKKELAGSEGIEVASSFQRRESWTMNSETLSLASLSDDDGADEEVSAKKFDITVDTERKEHTHQRGFEPNKTDNSVSQDEGDTASLGDLLSVFGSQSKNPEAENEDFESKHSESAKEKEAQADEKIQSMEVDSFSGERPTGGKSAKSQPVLSSAGTEETVTSEPDSRGGNVADAAGENKLPSYNESDKDISGHGNDGETVSFAMESGDTASMGDLAEILGSQSSQIMQDSEKARASVDLTRTAASPSSSLSSGEKQASISAVASPEEAFTSPHTQPAKKILGSSDDRSDSTVSPADRQVVSSPSQSEGDTASLGDLLSVFESKKRRETGLSFGEGSESSPKTRYPASESGNGEMKLAGKEKDGTVVGIGEVKLQQSSRLSMDSTCSRFSNDSSTGERIETQLSQTPSQESCLSQGEPSPLLQPLQHTVHANLSFMGNDDRETDVHESVSNLEENESIAADLFHGDVEANRPFETAPHVESGGGDSLENSGVVAESPDRSSPKVGSHSPGDSKSDSHGAIASPVQDVATQAVLPAKSPLRLTPNSHRKPTPTRIDPSPRRIVNPLTWNSPARNTRNARKVSASDNTNEPAASPDQPGKRAHSELGKKNEDEVDVIDLEADHGYNAVLKRRKSSSHGPPLSQKENNTISVLSPQPKKNHIVGILSSRKKVRSALKSSHTFRSVAFGSPDAAEYRIGSPSVSMTPMPKDKARALFSIPNMNESAAASKTSLDAVENTVEIEADLNVLVDKITADNMKNSPELSPISNVRDGTAPMVLPGDYNVFKKNDDSLLSTCDSSRDESKSEGETVELEGGIDILLSNFQATSSEKVKLGLSRETESSPLAQEKQKEIPESPANTSIEMTDAQSIASLNSAKAEKFTSHLQLDAQKLIFSPKKNASSSSEFSTGNGSMEVDEDNTVELENGMTGLLDAIGVKEGIASANYNGPLKEQNSHSTKDCNSKKTNTKISFDDSPNPIPRKARRTSITSRRFTIEGGDRILVAKDASVLAMEASHVSERSVSFQSPVQSEIGVSDTSKLPEICLSLNELLNTCGMREGELDPHILQEQDSMAVLHASIKSGCGIAYERWNQFLQAVCGEVERRTEGGGHASDSLYEVFHEKPARFIQLQDSLHMHDNTLIKRKVKELIDSVHVAIKSEWESWLAIVMDSFGNPLNELFKEVDLDLLAVDEALQSCYALESRIEFISKKNIQKTRRQSLQRRKTAASAIENEIQDLESTIAGMESTLKATAVEEGEYEQTLGSYRCRKAAIDAYEETRSVALSSQKSCMSLKGLHSWSPVELDDTKLVISTLGTTKLSCTTLVYDSSLPKNVTAKVCAAARIPECIKRSVCTFSRPVEIFMGRSFESLCRTLVKRPCSRIAHGVQKFAWALGRLDSAASELQGILNRYHGTLVDKGDCFGLTIEFHGCDVKLSVDLAIDMSYPSLPLEVRIDVWEGNIDLEGIHRALVKNARPGFGYLSRVCDIVSAYVK